MQHTHPVILAKAGIHFSARKMLRAWHGFFGRLSNVLCLADPWVPAFAGTTIEK
jgi:hypothetical protein